MPEPLTEDMMEPLTSRIACVMETGCRNGVLNMVSASTTQGVPAPGRMFSW